MDRLALAEEEGMAAALGLRGREPLKGQRVGRRLVADPHLPGARGQRDAKALAEHRLLRAQLERDGGAGFRLRVVHGQSLGVEVEDARVPLGEDEGRGAAEESMIEVDGQGQPQVSRRSLFGVDERVRVEASHEGLARRAPRPAPRA